MNLKTLILKRVEKVPVHVVFTMTSDPLTMGRAAMGTNLKIVARSLKKIEKDYHGARGCILSPHSLLLLLVTTCLFHMKPIDFPSEVSQQSHGTTVTRVAPTPKVVPRSKAINKVVNVVTNT